MSEAHAPTTAQTKHTRPSICRLCIAHCDILATVEAGKLTQVSGDPNKPLFKGYTCPKSRALPELHNHPARLRCSQKRDAAGALRPIASATASREIAEQPHALVQKYGPRSVAVYSGTNSLLYLVGPMAAYALLRALGSPMFFTANTIDQPNKQIAQALDGIWRGGDQNFEHTDTWPLIGVNPIISKAAGIPFQNPAQKLKEAVHRGGFRPLHGHAENGQCTGCRGCIALSHLYLPTPRPTAGIITPLQPHQPGPHEQEAAPYLRRNPHPTRSPHHPP